MKKHAAIILLSVLLLSCAGRQSNENGHSTHNAASANHGSHHSNMQSSPGASAADYDLQFIDSMIAHHQGAVDMAMLAEDRSASEQIKELAEDIIEDQEREMARMSEWRDAWFPEKPKAINMELPGMNHGMSGMDLGKLGSLKGKEFDLEFTRQMIPHHEGAIQMAKDLQNRSTRAELKELATSIISSQQDEIDDMREWSDKWKNQ